MTISITASSCSYVSDGSNLGPYAIKSGANGIYIETASELLVEVVNGTTATTLALGVNYTVAGAGSDAASMTLLAPVTAGHTIRMTRVTPITQTLNLSQAGAFSPASIMGALDKGVRIDQDQQRQIDSLQERVASATLDAAASAAAAASSASSAEASADEAANFALSAASTYDSFDDRYLGAKTTDPATDNDGGGLLVGALYFNSSTNEMRVWSGEGWSAAYLPSTSSVSAFNGRTGAVSPQAGDYTTSQITGVSPFARTILDDVDAVDVRATIGAAAATDLAAKADTTALAAKADTTAMTTALAAKAPSSGVFYKRDSASVAFTKTGADAVSIKAGTIVDAAGVLVSFAADTAVAMPTLNLGTDYAIYVCTDSTIRADASFTAPTGYTTTNSRRIGGFHYAPGGNATAQSGGDTTAAVNEFSLWDLKWRPAATDPRGMTLVGGAFWCDIYLLGVDHHLNGTSKYNVTIADGSSPPKVASVLGGNGSATYSGLTWWHANECMQAAGKDLLSVGEFCAAAYGTTESSSGGTDPVSTILRQAYTSKWGVMLATGNLWVWGRDWNMRWDGGGGFNWRSYGEGRGQQYIGGDVNLVAAILGGVWSDGAYSGSRASNWVSCPWSSSGSIGARGRCDHLRPV